MNFRTDLALEVREALTQVPSGVKSEELSVGVAKITRIAVETKDGSLALNKPIGNYITIEVPPFSDNSDELDERLTAVSNELMRLIPKTGDILVVGLGNAEITPDALGPQTTNFVLATRHITGEISRSAGLGDLRHVAVLAPGVLGQTGIETGELVLGLIEKLRPSALIVIDALASRKLSRLGCTVQISDSGIAPGSGVGNHRKEITKETMGIPVIALGVPTVVDAATLAIDLAEEAGASKIDYEALKRSVEPRGAEMVVTPREIDLLVERASRLIALSINKCLHPHIDPEDMLALVS